MPSPASLARAEALLDAVPLVDAHNDLPWVIRKAAKGDVAAYDLTRVHQDGDTDIPRLRKGRLAAQFWAAFVPTRHPHSARTTLEQIDVALRIISTHPDTFVLATRAADVVRAKRAGRIASFVTVESGVGLENALDPLRVWHAAGVRLLTLCHNETLDWIDSATDEARVPGGLHPFGRAVVEECNRLGIVVDLAHVAPHAMHKVLDAARAPVLWSHSNAFALCGHPRNVPDDILARVAENGGVVCATFVPAFISKASLDYVREFQKHGKSRDGLDVDKAMQDKERREGRWPRGSVEEWVDHVDYLVGKVGIDHVGIGSDFFGSTNPDGIEDVSRFPQVIAALLDRGYSERQAGKIAGRNVLRVLRRVERVGDALRRTEGPRTGRLEDHAG